MSASGRLFKPGDAWGLPVTGKNATGALANADATPVCTVYRNGTADGTVTVTVTNPSTGQYALSCTIPSGYAAGDRVSFLLTAAYGGVSTGEFVEHVRLVQWSVTALPNAAAGGAGGVPVLAGSTLGADVQSALTTQGYTTGRALKIDNADVATSTRQPSGNVMVGGYAAGVDPATLVLATPANKLATGTAGVVTVGGYAAGVDPATLVLATPANKLATGTGGVVTVGAYATGQSPGDYVLLDPTHRIATDPSGFVTATGGGSGGLTITDVQTAMTNQGYTPIRAPKLDHLDVDTSTRQPAGNVTVGGYAAGVDPATLIQTIVIEPTTGVTYQDFLQGTAAVLLGEIDDDGAGHIQAFAAGTKLADANRILRFQSDADPSFATRINAAISAS
jgi:hypothetical protein